MIPTVTKYGRRYKVYNGVYYSADTSDEMIFLLDEIKGKRERVEFRWGNPKTGEDWGDEHDVVGTIGQSTGEVKIPLLIHSRRSMGGGGILTGSIVKVMKAKGKRTIYQHPKYHLKSEIKDMLKTNKSMEKAFKRLGVI